MSVPTRMGDWWYYSRTLRGQAVRRPLPVPRSPVAGRLDPAANWLPASSCPASRSCSTATLEAEGHDFFSLGAFSLSHDGTLLAYSVDIVGDERYTLRFKDLATGELLARRDPRHRARRHLGASTTVTSSIMTVDESWRPDTVWRHKLGTDRRRRMSRCSTSPTSGTGCAVGSTRSEKYLMIWVGSKITSEGWVLESDEPRGRVPGAPAATRGRRVRRRARGGRGRGPLPDPAQRRRRRGEGRELRARRRARVRSVGHDDPDRAPRTTFGWRKSTPSPTTSCSSYRREALTRLAVWPLTDDGYGELTEIEFDEELFSVGLGANPEWAQPTLRLGFTSFITPGAGLRLRAVDG